MQRKEYTLTVASQTDRGLTHDCNADSLGSIVPADSSLLASRGALFVVVDGDGPLSSQLAVDTIEAAYYQNSADAVLDALVLAVQQASVQLYQRRKAQALEWTDGFATCTAVALCGDKLYGVHVGNCRAYLVRQEQIRQLTRDHTWVEVMVRAGKLRPCEKRTHPKRYILINYPLGSTDQPLEVDTFVESVQGDENLLLCTDGLWHPVSDDETRALVEQYTPHQSVAHLIRLANERGGLDNISVVAARLSL